MELTSTRWARLALLAAALPLAAQAAKTQDSTTGAAGDTSAQADRAPMQMRAVTRADREAAAARAAAQRAAKTTTSSFGPQAQIQALGTTDYLGGTVGNWTFSPAPVLAVGGGYTGGIRKFVDTLPGLGLPGCEVLGATNSCHANNLGNYIPIAAAIANAPGVPQDGDYYELGVVDYTQQFHTDLPATTQLRGYKDLSPAAEGKARYLGPVIIAQRDRPVRLKMTNLLPTSEKAASQLFIPMDATIMGAGAAPQGGNYAENRVAIHLHGGLPPWISDGTAHQWFVPANDPTPYKRGPGAINVPDMPDPGDGAMTFFWPNQMSSRLMWYHDHAIGITRLNAYVGMAAGYLLIDNEEQDLIKGTNVSGINPLGKKVLPDVGVAEYTFGIPLVIQDKGFVPDPATLAATDPTWNWGPMGNLWFPHVYMPNQSPNDLLGVNPMGRWDYGPWFWPVFPTVVPTNPDGSPGVPNPSLVPEAFMDTAVINGQAYPKLTVGRRAYRFRLLNGSNDRNWNLSLFYADASGTEVKMVPAIPTGTWNPYPKCAPGVTRSPAAPNACWPETWPVDGRAGGVPAPDTAGPSFIQIGTEAGFLAKPTVIDPTPVGYEYNRRSVVVLNVIRTALFMGPAERADVIIDFSQVPAGSKIILYNDSPAPVPAFDERNDYYTGNPDTTSSGGAPSTIAGYGPNTRTLMRFDVEGATADPAYDPADLNALLPVAFANSQPAPVVPSTEYGTATGGPYPGATVDNYAKIQATSMTFTPIGSATPITMQLQPKAIQELFEPIYGRMNAILGVEKPFTTALVQTTVPYYYVDPPTEILKKGETQLWKITHNGVDTHTVHFHLFNAQVVNRVGWDGQVVPPDANEIGWKEAVKMNPLQDIIIAFRAASPTVPFKVPTSVRLLDPSSLPGTTGQFTGIDPNGLPVTVTNVPYNFGAEYVWHCHLLGHEENDMMRAIVVTDTTSAEVWRDAATGDVKVTQFEDVGTLGALTSLGAVPAPWTIAATGNFRGIAGGKDILWRNATTGEVYLWNTTNWTLTAAASLGTIPTAWQIMFVADLNGDGKSDVVWNNAATGEWYAWLMDGSTQLPASGSLGTIPAAWSIVASGDLDGDGKADLVWRNGTSGEVYVWLMNGRTQIGGGSMGTVSTTWSITGAGDVNGDGKADIFWNRAATGDNYVWYVSGNTQIGGGALPSTGATGAIVDVKDLDNDGRTDLLVRDTVSGNLRLINLQGTTAHWDATIPAPLGLTYTSAR